MRLLAWWRKRRLAARQRKVVEAIRDAALERQLVAALPNRTRRAILRNEIETREIRLLVRALELGCWKRAVGALHPDSRAARAAQLEHEARQLGGGTTTLAGRKRRTA